MYVFVCLLWKTQCLSKWKGEEVYDLGMKCVMYWKCIMCLSSRVLVLDVTQSLIGVVLDLFLMQCCDSELPEVLEWATKLSFSSPRLYFPIIPAFFSLTSSSIKDPSFSMLIFFRISVRASQINIYQTFSDTFQPWMQILTGLRNVSSASVFVSMGGTINRHDCDANEEKCISGFECF